MLIAIVMLFLRPITGASLYFNVCKGDYNFNMNVKQISWFIWKINKLILSFLFLSFTLSVFPQHCPKADVVLCTGSGARCMFAGEMLCLDNVVGDSEFWNDAYLRESVSSSYRDSMVRSESLCLMATGTLFSIMDHWPHSPWKCRSTSGQSLLLCFLAALLGPKKDRETRKPTVRVRKDKVQWRCHSHLCGDIWQGCIPHNGKTSSIVIGAQNRNSRG